mgnify:CR=1 FL=1
MLLAGYALPTSAEPSTEAQQCLRAGLQLKAAKQYWEAAAELEQAIELQPDWVDAYWAAAWAYSHMGQGLRAVALVQEVLRLEPQGERAEAAWAAILRKTGRSLSSMPTLAAMRSRPSQPSVAPQPNVATNEQPQAGPVTGPAAAAGKAPPFPRPPGLPPLGECLFEDDFSAGQDKWQAIGGTVQIEDGALCIKGGKEGDPFPVVLIKQQFDEPRLAVEFRAEAQGPSPGDVGINLGGYLVSLGGWNNARTVLFKLVGGQIKELASQNVGAQAGRTYHCLLIRDGGRLSYFLDGKPLLRAVDPEPVTGDEARKVLALTYFGRHVHFKNVLVHKLP